MMIELVKRLPPGPLDVVGDVHGEREALEALLGKLGYDANGEHPDARRLVFLGDLCDRGPDSPGVIQRVQSLIQRGRACAVAGNHELNLLRGEKKHGNHWFFGVSRDPEFGECAAITEDKQEPILEFFRSLPVALEREDLRIVHAAWIDPLIDRCRTARGPMDAAYRAFDSAMRQTEAFQELERAYEHERRRLGAALKTHTSKPPLSHAIGPFEAFYQMRNPIRVATSGVERATEKAFFAAGKWRWVERIAWWHEYSSHIPVLFGHYWRWWNPAVHQHLSKGEPQLFAADPVGPFMAAGHSAFCIDFSVGSRYKQRIHGHSAPYHGRLAAMRWPERELVFDDEPASFLG